MRVAGSVVSLISKISKPAMVLGTFGGLFASAAQASEAVASGGDPYKSLASGIAIGVAALGGALGQGKAAAAALDGIARNPSAQGKLFVPFILSLVLMESLVILAFLVAFVKL